LAHRQKQIPKKFALTREKQNNTPKKHKNTKKDEKGAV